MGDTNAAAKPQDSELHYLAEARAALRLAREALAMVGQVRQRRGVNADDIALADDELREFDGGLHRAEERRTRELRVFSGRGDANARGGRTW